jgi:Xaa-Pro aminopeptidase
VAREWSFLELIRPGVTPEQVLDEAAARMQRVIDRSNFSKPIYEQAARRALAFGGHLSHPVGMCVHDVGNYRGTPLQPGLVLTLDPMMWVPEEKRYIRVEDTLLITETGLENFTQAAPLELDDVERVMQEDGMLQHYPALWPDTSV